jgi:hypothetical protein
MSIKGLWDYLPFKLTLCFGAVLAFICSVIILKEDVFTKNIHFCGASDCFDMFIDLFALPIDIVKATAALLAIVALVHKSEETQEQIRITTMQNKYSNFYSHRKTIKEELNEKLNLNNLLVLSDFNRFYRVFFPKNTPENFNFKADEAVLPEMYKSFITSLFEKSAFQEVYKNTVETGEYFHLSKVKFEYQIEAIKFIGDELKKLFPKLGLECKFEFILIDLKPYRVKHGCMSHSSFESIPDFLVINNFSMDELFNEIDVLNQMIFDVLYIKDNIKLIDLGDALFPLSEPWFNWTIQSLQVQIGRIKDAQNN